MKSYLRIQSPWAQLFLFLGFLLAFTFVASFIGLGYLWSKGLISVNQKSFDFSNPQLVQALKSVQIIYTIVGFFCPALLYALVTFRYRPLRFLGFRASQRVNFYAFAVILMMVSFPLASWLGELNEHVPLAKWMVDYEKEAAGQMDAFLKTTSSRQLFYNLIIIAFIPAVCEEACFRGAMQRIFIHVCRIPWIGILLSAIFFSAFHMEFAGFLPRMFLGVLLGALYWYSGSLWVSITAHFFNNAAQLVLIWYYPRMADENPTVPIYAAVACALIVWGLLLLVQRNSGTTYKAMYEYDQVDLDEHF